MASPVVFERSDRVDEILASARRWRPNLVVVVVAFVVGIAVFEGRRAGSLQDHLLDLVRWMPLILLAGCALPVLALIAARPQRGLLILAALVPFNGLLIVAPYKPPFAEGWKEALALYTLLWALLARARKPRVKRPLPRYVQPLVAYFAVAAISAIIVGGVQGLVGIKVGFFWVIAGLIAWIAPLDARDRDNLVTVLMVDAVLTSLFGLYQQRLGAFRLVDLGYAWDTNIRFTGSFLRSISSFPNPFNFAFFLTFVLLMAIPICLEDPKRKRNARFLACTPIVGLALLFTFVRGAWIALGVGLLYLAIRRYRVLLLGVPIALIGLAVLPGSFSSSAFQERSFNERQLGWSDNVAKVVSAPLGNGIGTTGASAEKAVQVEHKANEIVYQPDNQYFKVLYELGVPGLWFFIFMLVTMLAASRTAERVVAPGDQPLVLGTTGHILGAIVASTVATWMEIFPNDLYLWLMLSVILTATHESS